jgi:hypothetical protein
MRFQKYRLSSKLNNSKHTYPFPLSPQSPLPFSFYFTLLPYLTNPFKFKRNKLKSETQQEKIRLQEDLSLG